MLGIRRGPRSEGESFQELLCIRLGIMLRTERERPPKLSLPSHSIVRVSVRVCPSVVRRPGACPTCPTDRPTCLPFPLECPQKEHQPSLSRSLSLLLLLLPAHSSHPSSDLSSLSPSLPFTTWAVSAAALRHGERPSAAAPSVYLARPPSSLAPARPCPRPPARSLA